MANVPVLLDPAQIQALNALVGDKSMMALFTDGLSGGQAVPEIRRNGPRFSVVMPEMDEPVLLVGKDGNPLPTLSVVFIQPSPGVLKRYYIKKADPNDSESYGPPDCYSNHGVYPEPDAKSKQCETCAACPQNVFGTATNTQGVATKGKKCGDNKVMIVFTPAIQQLTGIKQSVFRFTVPPSSLGNLKAYTSELKRGGIEDPLCVVTKLGFDHTAAYPIQTFTMGGVLNIEQAGRMLSLRNSPEALALLPEPANRATPTPIAPVQAAPPARTEPAPAAPPPAQASNVRPLPTSRPAPAAPPPPSVKPAKAAPVRAAAPPAMDDASFGAIDGIDDFGGVEGEDALGSLGLGDDALTAELGLNF